MAHRWPRQSESSSSDPGSTSGTTPSSSQAESSDPPTSTSVSDSTSSSSSTSETTTSTTTTTTTISNEPTTTTPTTTTNLPPTTSTETTPPPPPTTSSSETTSSTPAETTSFSSTRSVPQSEPPPSSPASISAPSSSPQSSVSSGTTITLSSSTSQQPSVTIFTSTFYSLSTDSGGSVSTVLTSTSVETAPLGTNTANSDDFSHNKGAIIAVALVGALVVACAAVAGFLLFRRQQRKKAIRRLHAATEDLKWRGDDDGPSTLSPGSLDRNPMDVEDVPVVAGAGTGRFSHRTSISHESTYSRRSLADEHSRSSVYLAGGSSHGHRSLGQAVASLNPGVDERGVYQAVTTQGNPSDRLKKRASALSAEEGAWFASGTSHHSSSHGHGQRTSSIGHGAASSSHGHSSHGHEYERTSSTGHDAFGNQSESSHRSRGSGRVQFSLEPVPRPRESLAAPPVAFKTERSSTREKVKGLLHRLSGSVDHTGARPSIDTRMLSDQAPSSEEPSPFSPSSLYHEESIALSSLPPPRPPALYRDNDASGSGSGSGSGTDTSGSGYGSGSSSLFKPVPLVSTPESPPSPVDFRPDSPQKDARYRPPSLLGQLPPYPVRFTTNVEPSPAISEDGERRENLLDYDKTRLRSIAEGPNNAAASTGSLNSSLRDHWDYSRPIRPAGLRRTETSETFSTSSPLNTPIRERHEAFG